MFISSPPIIFILYEYFFPLVVTCDIYKEHIKKQRFSVVAAAKKALKVLKVYFI